MTDRSRTLTLPVAMAAGLIFSGFFARLDFLTTYLIATMLFITFCGITPDRLRFAPIHRALLGVQILAGCAAYLILRPLNPTVAQGAMVCILTPVAVSSVVVGGMLGANVATLTTFSILSNVATALAAPVIFSLTDTQTHLPFIDSLVVIMKKVVPLLGLPLLLAFTLRALAPRIHRAVGRSQSASFFLWALALTIVTGRTVRFVAAQGNTHYRLELALAASALAICLLQFAVGRTIGRRYGDTAAGGQSLGQKNTILAIWMSQSYLDPISSIAPAAYVIWQNAVNSYQLWRRFRK